MARKHKFRSKLPPRFQLSDTPKVTPEMRKEVEAYAKRVDANLFGKSPEPTQEECAREITDIVGRIFSRSSR